MHELWLCKNIIEIISQHAASKQYTRIKKIYLEIGELAAIEKSALIFSFNIIANETIAKDAILEIISVPGKAVCDSCSKTLTISQYSESCHYCGSFSLNIIQGEELRVKSMEVE
jgi:hydrogenase nickel incorporation protein HypA/HybF